MKDEERRLFEALRDREISGVHHLDRTTFSIGEELGIPCDRATVYAEKWTSRGWYEFGMRPLFGRLTKLGMEQ